MENTVAGRAKYERQAMTAVTTYYYQVYILIFGHAAHFIGWLTQYNMLAFLWHLQLLGEGG
jgi:hypothetical protein